MVNNALAIDDSLIAPGPFWRKPLAQAEMLNVGLRSHYVATYHAAPLLLAAGQQGAGAALVALPPRLARAAICSPAYGAQKAGCDKMAADMAVDFEGSGVAAVSLWLGVQRTERTTLAARQREDAYGRLPGAQREPAVRGAHAARPVWRDPALAQRSGQTLIVAELAQDYGVRDDDGRSPPSWREWLGGPRPFHPARVS